jgi:hypothetical protein
MPNQDKIFLGKPNFTAKVLAVKFVGLSAVHGSLLPIPFANFRLSIKVFYSV